MGKTKKTQTYESALLELQDIVNALEGEQLGVDELSSSVKRASELLAFCKEKLHKTEEELDGILKKI